MGVARRAAGGIVVAAAAAGAIAVVGGWETRGGTELVAPRERDSHRGPPAGPAATPVAASADGEDRRAIASQRVPDPPRESAAPIVEVTDAEGAPIEGAWVEVAVHAPWPARTEFEKSGVVLTATPSDLVLLRTLADGIARRLEPVERIASVRCRHPGFLPAAREAPFAASPIHLALERADAPAELIVHVLSRDGSPVGAAEVACVLASNDLVVVKAWAQAASPATPSPIADGVRLAIDPAFEELPFRLRARGAGHLPGEVDASAPLAGHAREATIELEPRQRLLHGRVIDVRTGSPLPRARIDPIEIGRLPDREFQCDSQGRFLLEDVEGARVAALRVEQDGYATGYFSVAGLESLQRDGEPLLTLDEEGATIEATVVDAAGFPIPSVTIEVRYLLPDGRSLVVDRPWTRDDGRATARRLPATRVEVARVDPERRTRRDLRTIDLTNGGRFRCDFVVRRDATLVVELELAPDSPSSPELFLFDLTAGADAARIAAHDEHYGSVRSFEALAPGLHLVRIWDRDRHFDRVVELRSGALEKIGVTIDREGSAVPDGDHARCRRELSTCGREALR